MAAPKARTAGRVSGTDAVDRALFRDAREDGISSLDGIIAARWFLIAGFGRRLAEAVARLRLDGGDFRVERLK
jgi:hypothetical protein